MITLLLLILPLVAGLLLMLTRGTNSRNLHVLASILALAECVLSVFGLNAFLKNPEDSLLVFNASWLKDFSINFHLGWDGLSALMILLSTMVGFLIILSIYFQSIFVATIR